MDRFCITKLPQEGARPVVHRVACIHAPPFPARLDLGYFRDCYSAVCEARQFHDSLTGRRHCIPCCHRPEAG